MTTEERLEKAIQDLKDFYERAKNNPCITKPLAWALYRTWRKYNRGKH